MSKLVRTLAAGLLRWQKEGMKRHRSECELLAYGECNCLPDKKKNNDEKSLTNSSTKL